jgi:hypothetical protein
MNKNKVRILKKKTNNTIKSLFSSRHKNLKEKNFILRQCVNE